MTDIQRWAERLRDRRSKQVVFLSHCLLNENTRYLGGACRPGCVEELVQPYLARGVGIVQMPCPEQRAWGGLLKRRLVAFFGTSGTVAFGLRKLLLPVLRWQTRRAYRKIARQVAEEIEDYVCSGYWVVEIVGVDGSPSCGVGQTLQVRRALDRLGRLQPTAAADDINAIVADCVTAGGGLFIEALQRELSRRRLQPPLRAHSLLAELQESRSQ